MGKKIVDEDMVLNIIINGDNGKNELFKLEQAVRDLNSENAKLERGLQKYDKQLSSNEATIIRYTRSLEKETANHEKQQGIYEKSHNRLSELLATYKQLDASAKESKFGKKVRQEMTEVEAVVKKSGESGQKSLRAQDELRKGIEKLTKENVTLSRKREEDTAILNKNKAAVQDASAKIGNLRKNLDITTLSIDELNQEIARTNTLFRQADPNTPAWNEYQQTLVKLRTRQQELSTQSQQTKGVLCRMADGVNKYWNVVVSGMASFAGIFFSIDGAVDKFVKFDDVLSDAQKTTGLTKDQIKELNGSLKEVDTRSLQDELMGLVIIGGKLGVEGQDNLEGFARAADKINVALKEDLGGDTEESIRQVGKLVDIFNVKDEFGIEQGMLKVGSVINELGAASTANEGYIVEFSKRVAGVAPSAGVSVSAVMGLAATLDQFGQQSEASSTVYSQMMTKMFKDTGTFASIAKMNIKDFSELLNTDANEAFVRVLEGVKNNNGGMEALVKNLGEMDLKGVRATTVLGALANNTDVLRAQQELANKSFEEGISLTNEFNIKNNNDAAQADKRKKVREELIKDLGEKLQPVIVGCNNAMNTGLKIVSVLIEFFAKYGATLAAVSIAVVGLIAKEKIMHTMQKIQNSLSKESVLQGHAKILAMNAEIASLELKAVSTKKATVADQLHIRAIQQKIAATRASNAALAKTPWGAIAVGAALAVTLIVDLVRNMNNLSESQKRVNEASKEFEKSAASEQLSIDRLFGKLKSATEGTKEFDAAKKAIISKYGPYLDGLDDETKSLKNVEAAYRAISEAAKQAARDRAIESATTKASDAYVEVEVENLKKIKKLMEEKFGALNGTKYFEQLRQQIEEGKGLSVEMQSVVAKFNETRSIAAPMGPATTFKVNDIDVYIKRIQKGKEILKTEMKELDTVLGTGTPQAPKSIEALNAELTVATKKLEDLRRVRPDIFTEDDIVLQESYISRLRKSIKELEDEQEAASKKPTATENDDNIDTSVFDKKIIELKQQYAQGKKTKEEYEKELDDLELEHLQYRLNNFKGTEDKRLELQQKIADKQVSIREKNDKQSVDKEKEYINALLAEHDTLSRKEELAYTNRLKQAGVYGKDREKLTANQLKALDILEKQHQDNLKKIKDDAEKKKASEYQKEANTQIKNQQTGNAIELAQLKAKHAEALSVEGLSAAERRSIKKHQAKEELELAEKQAMDMINLMNEIMANSVVDEWDIGQMLMTDEQKAEFEQKIAELKQKIAEFKGEMIKPDEGGWKDPGTDILGMTQEKWEEFFQHLKDGEFGLEDLAAAVGVLQNAWAVYDKYKTATEKKELKQYEKDIKQKKSRLDKQLNDGVISQEQYTARVSQLDADLDAKKDQIERQQAKRQKKMAIFGAIINTALGITSALKEAWPLNLILSAIIGTMGAVQIATISAQQYAKGKYPVIGADDGQTYQADYAGDSLKTGIYQTPTLGLFSEKQPEMVVDGATTRKLVLDYPNIYNAIMDVSKGRTPQYAEGHYPTNASVSSDTEIQGNDGPDPEIKQLLRKNIQMLEGLQNMEVVISMYGRNGLQKALKKAQHYEQKINS